MSSPDTAPPQVTLSIPGLGSSGLSAAPAVKIALIGLLVLIMLIPMALVGGVISDREAYQQKALAGFRASWGPAQSVLGPILVVPFLTGSRYHEQRQYLHVAANRLVVTARLDPEIRKRGLFHAVVYGAEAELSGQFLIPADALASEPDAQPLWDESYIMLGATDLRALPPDPGLLWKNETLALGDASAQGTSSCGDIFLMTAHPNLAAAPAPDLAIPFETTLALRGTDALRVVPIGRQIDVTMSGPWATPGFGSEISPARYTIDDSGFEANWRVASNVETGRWVWNSTVGPDCGNGSYAALQPEGQIGTELLEPVPTYRMVERSAKYGVLFLVLSFLTYFLFETVARIRIHLVQYGLLGLSISLFALLLISFAEPLGFASAYGLSSVAILAQASLFTASVTRRPKLAGLFALVLAGLFGFLYIVLSLESFALLAGAVALFLVLSAVMVVTRRIDWSSRTAGLRAEAAP
jgi:inner membrane protein